MRARAFVSALAAVLGFYGSVAVIAVALGAAVPRAWVDGSMGIAASTLPLVVAAALVNAVQVRRGWSSWRRIGWLRPSRTGTAWLAATGSGLVMAAAALVVAVVAGRARIALTAEPVGAYLAVAGRVAVGLGVAALAEELVFRGYPLARLAEPCGRVGASVLLAIAFAAAHLPNPDVSTLGLVNIGLASLVLSAAFFTPGALPAAWGVHFGWNGGLALGADAPVSGINLDMPLLEFEAGRVSWVTGGAFGPEGGIAASVAMGGALIWFGRRAARAKGGEPT